MKIATLSMLALTSALYSQTTTAVAPQPSYAPITTEGRMKWFAVSTVGPASLAGGVFSSAFGTALNQPKEYGPTWEGFGKRYGMRLTGVATGNLIEAGVGAAWGEDPRYFRAPGRPVRSRIGNAFKLTLLARDRQGDTMPAYARYIALTGNNFLSNTWRADSEATTGRASVRVLEGVLGRFASNLFQEFWPDLTRRLSRRKSASTQP